MQGQFDRRVLLLAPTSRDATTTQSLFANAGITVEVCRHFDDLLQSLEKGAGALLIPEESVSTTQRERLTRSLASQPPWSDLPILVLTRPGADSAESGDAVRTLGNVTLLERPVQMTTLLSAVRTALRARERQYQIREHLEQRAQAEESLRLADQRKDEFLATLGHELRNPLAPLLSGLHLLKSAGIQDPVVGRVTSVMERQITHLVTLVDDLLEVSRITRGVIGLHCQRHDLAFIVESAIDTGRPALEGAGHQLIVELPETPIVVFGDAVRLTQVFANLLTNAAKYTNTGGTIHLTVAREGDQARVSVRDNGIGIPAEHLTSVFDMFMQVDRSSRRAQGGLGIGLTLVRSLIAMHGGRVEARSDGPLTGSEFIVHLPVLAESKAQIDRLPAPAGIPPLRILVVDDNRDAAETLGALLGTLGGTVSIAHSGRAALEVIEKFRPDAVLLDIGMPEMDGYEVARRIRETTAADVLIIALTGWGQEQDYRQSRAAGVDHHLVKPPDMNKLRELLMSVVAVRTRP
jgi:signal transduction histidine kinase